MNSKKIAKIDIEETNNIIYQLEMLKCCRIVINKDFYSYQIIIL